MKKRIFALAMSFVMGLSLTACGKEEERTADGYAKEIYLYNWTEYMDPDVIKQFEDEYGIKVVESTYQSNDEMLAKLLAGNDGEYDIAVPTNFYINAMLENGLIEELDKENIPNIKNIDQDYVGLDYDPEGKYTVPYMGTICVWLGNTKLLDTLGKKVEKIGDIEDSALESNIILVDDPQLDVGVGLLANGYEFSSTNLDEIDEAKDWLLEYNKNIKAFPSSPEARDAMAKGEAALGFIYGGEALQAMQVNEDLEVVMKKENVTLSIDNFVILKGTKHKKEAELFIDFLLRPEISAQLTEYFQFVSFNEAAYDLIDKELVDSGLVVLDDDTKSRLTIFKELDGEAISKEVDVMTEVKSSR